MSATRMLFSGPLVHELADVADFEAGFLFLLYRVREHGEAVGTGRVDSGRACGLELLEAGVIDPGA